MFFIRLGLLNARRNIGRSVLAVFAVSLAAGFMTYSFSLSRGYPHLLRAAARSILGGEIVAYARSFGGAPPEQGAVWQHDFITESPSSDLADFYPELFNRGYLYAQQEKTRFEEADLQAFKEALPGISFVYPRYQMPAYIMGNEYRYVPLRGRDFELDDLQAVHPGSLVKYGDWFNERSNNFNVAVVSYYNKQYPASIFPRRGDRILVRVPRIKMVDGEPIFIESKPRYFTFVVIGVVEVPTRAEAGSRESDSPEAQLCWDFADIQIPLGTWQRIWHTIGGEEYHPEQITLGYNNLSYLEDATLAVQKLF